MPRKPDVDERLRQVLKVAHLFYEKEMTKTDIAAKSAPPQLRWRACSPSARARLRANRIQPAKAVRIGRTTKANTTCKRQWSFLTPTTWPSCGG